jgi:hypothetical protein
MKNTKSKKLIFLFLAIFDNFIANSKNEKHFYFYFFFTLFFEIPENPKTNLSCD